MQGINPRSSVRTQIFLTIEPSLQPTTSWPACYMSAGDLNSGLMVAHQALSSPQVLFLHLEFFGVEWGLTTLYFLYRNHPKCATEPFCISFLLCIYYIRVWVYLCANIISLNYYPFKIRLFTELFLGSAFRMSLLCSTSIPDNSFEWDCCACPYQHADSVWHALSLPICTHLTFGMPPNNDFTSSWN